MADQPRIALLNDSFPPTIDGVAQCGNKLCPYFA